MDSEDRSGRGLPPEPDYLNPKPRRITRRKALTVLGAGGAAGVALTAGARAIRSDETSSTRRPGGSTTTTAGSGEQTTTTEPPPTDAMAKWSEADTWGGRVPGSGDVAPVDKPIVLDVDTQVAGIDIQPGGELVFDPEKSHTLTSTGNVVVHGALRMRPASMSVQHVLAFAGIDESRYVGGHTDDPLDTDIGVWILHGGVLDLMGTAKKAWTNLAGDAPAGAATITVDDASGWQVGDEVVVTPTEIPESDHHWEHHDRRTIAAVSGNNVSLDQSLEFDHPAVTVREGVTHRAEVLNLTRNVHVEGAPDARPHIMVLHGTAPQTMGYVGLRHLGPQGVLGRYSLHFHMCDDGADGSTLEGMVAQDTGNHAFVVHLTNGVTLTDCVVHDSIDDAYWWDQRESPDEDPPISKRVIYERCVASYIKIHDRPHATCGFLLGAGEGNVANHCVATGVEGKSNPSAGFRWGSNSNDFNPWVFEDDISHNNAGSAAYYWQNNVGKGFVDRLTGYHCAAGILAGAYANLVSYRDCTVYRTRGSGLVIHATPSPLDRGEEEHTITYEGMYIDTAGMSEYAVEVDKHVLDHGRVTEVSGSTFKGGTTAQVAFPEAGKFAQLYNFTDCTFDGNAFWLHNRIKPDSQIRVVGGNLGSIEVHPSGGPGESQADWNATSTQS